MQIDLLVVLAILLLVVIAAVLLMRKRRSEQLAGRFGPEYDRTVGELGSRSKAEAELLARQKRVSRLNIVPLPPEEAERFRGAWRSMQARFVDSPAGVVAEADTLVRQLMERRGYPMGDFERCAADISVDHPLVVEHYRAAHDIALLDRQGKADTEALRRAVVHYRALFAELLEVEPPRTAAQPSSPRESRTSNPPRFFGRGQGSERALARDEAARPDRERRSERR